MRDIQAERGVPLRANQVAHEIQRRQRPPLARAELDALSARLRGDAANVRQSRPVAMALEIAEAESLIPELKQTFGNAANRQRAMGNNPANALSSSSSNLGLTAEAAAVRPSDEDEGKCELGRAYFVVFALKCNNPNELSDYSELCRYHESINARDPPASA